MKDEDEPERSEERVHDDEELARLLRFCTRKGPSFGMALASHEDVRVAARIRERARTELESQGLRVAELALGYHDDDVDITARLAELSQDAELIWVVGLDVLLRDSIGRPRDTAAIAGLNLGRDELPARVAARVVLWLGMEVYERFASVAWDLLQVMLTRFEFRAPEPLFPPARSAWLGDVPPDTGPSGDLEQAERLVALAAKSEDPLARADALTAAAELYFRQHRFDDAAALQLEASRALDDVDPARAAYSRVTLSFFEGARGREAVASELAVEAVASLTKLAPNSQRLASALGMLASYLELQNEFERALELRLTRQLPLLARLEGRHQQANALISAANNLRAQGQLEAALDILHGQLGPIVAELADDGLKAKAAGKIADIYLAQGKPDSAITLRKERQLPILEELGPRAEWASAMGEIAAARQAQGLFDEALRIRLEEQLPVLEQLHDLDEQSTVHGHISRLLFDLDRPPEAISAQRKALALSRQLESPLLVALDEDALAALLALHQPIDAREEIEQLMRSAVTTLRALDHPRLPDLEARAARLDIDVSGT